MTTPIERMRDNLRNAEGDSRKTFEVRVTKVLCRYFDVKPDLYDPLFGLNWFKDRYQLQFHLDAQNISVDVDKLFRAMTKTPAWKAYMDLLNMYDFGICALVVTYKLQGLYVFHNHLTLTPVAGHTRLFRRAASSDLKGVIFEPFEAFCMALTGVNA